MDYTILYGLLIVAIVIGITFLVKYLQRKKIINENDLIVIITLLGFSLEVVDEMKLKDDKKIKTILNVVLLTTSYMKASIEVVSEQDAFKYAIKLCDQFNLELTDNRKAILQQLVSMSLVNVNKTKTVWQ